MPSPWKWKAKSAPGAPATLLYEPGNWGDLLKHAWLVELLDHLAEADGAGLDYLDPFAGAPDYPLPPRAARRLAASGLAKLGESARPWTERNRWPGGAALAATRTGRPARVFDLHPDHRQALAADARFSLLAGDDGWDALARAVAEVEADAAGAEPADGAGTNRTGNGEERGGGRARLALVDPYDFLGEWRARLDVVARAAAAMPVLLYVYNRAGRGPEALRDYRAFRAALSAARGGARLWMARIAADAFCPAAWHEVFFLPDPALSARPEGEALGVRLEALAHTLAEAQRRAGVVEVE